MRAFEAIGRVRVVDRPPEVAGRGKGAVLNEGYRVLSDLLDQGDPLVAGFDPDEVVVGIVDADGHLEPSALHHVARLFADPRVGGVQMGVIIGNAEDGLMPRCQDLEFVGFSQLAQAARDRIGSVGLGGNGQFTRLVALQPWASALDGLPNGGSRPRPQFDPARLAHPLLQDNVGDAARRAHGPRWLRQRTRWAQGHYQCWDHVPKLLTAGTSALSRGSISSSISSLRS